MKSLVTGATGFIGAKLVHALAEKGDEIKVLAFPGEDPNTLPTAESVVPVYLNLLSGTAEKTTGQRIQAINHRNSSV